MDLKSLCQRIADRLGIDPLEIKYEEMIDDSRLYIIEEYVAINKKFENDYVECAKAIAHEYRHVFQLFYANMLNDNRARRWIMELSNFINSSNMDNEGMNYINQELELDAFAFTKFYLETFENFQFHNRITGLDSIIDNYIIINNEVFY